MHYFMFLAHPKPSSREYGVTDGAYVSCWVNDPIGGSAEVAARALIEEAGWDVDEREEAYPVDDTYYAPDDSGFERYKQAHLDGICAVFHRWAVGAPDE